MATILRDDYTAVYRTGTLHKVISVTPVFRKGRRVDGNGYITRCGMLRHTSQWRDTDPERDCKVCFPEWEIPKESA